jgi:hypothetical protein
VELANAPLHLPRAARRRRAVLLAVILATPIAGCGEASHGLVHHARSGVATFRARRPAPASAHPRFFAATSFWNAPLSTAAPIDGRSGALTGILRETVRAEVAAKRGPWISTSGFSTPIYTVPAGQPSVHVTLDNVNVALEHAFSAVPLPADARPAEGADAQLAIWQPATDRMWEFWGLHREADGWHTRWGGAMEHVSASAGYFDAGAWPGANSHWGATATSLPLVGGLITLEDLKQGHIDHAVALGVPDLAAGAVRWPAQRTDGGSAGQGAIPAGLRYRLDPRLDLAALSLPALVRMIAEAAQRYGLVVRDSSSVVDFYGEDPTRTGTNPYRELFGGEYPWQQLARFPWDHLEAIR